MWKLYRHLMLYSIQRQVVIIYKTYTINPSDPCALQINGIRVKCVDTIIHLDHLLAENVHELNMSKCIDILNRKCNMFLVD